MLKSISAFALAMLMCAPALADGMDYAPRRYYPQRFYLPPEQHVIEVVQPPWSGNFIINGARSSGRRLERPLRRRGLLQFLSPQHLRDVVRQRLVVVSKTESVPHTGWGLNELQREGAAGG